MNGATWHLDRFAAAIIKAGWCAGPRYGGEPPLVRVWHRDLTVIGESVMVRRCFDDTSWFATADRLLAPVSRPDLAAAQLIAILTPYRDAVEAAVPTKKPGRLRRLFGTLGRMP